MRIRFTQDCVENLFSNIRKKFPIPNTIKNIYDPNIKFSKLVHLKCYRTKTLFFVNNKTFNYFYEMEVIVRRYISYLKNINYDLIKFFLDKTTCKM
ncbi:hypothetical protein ACFW04_013617 [Cataglyphis niger]